MNATRQKVAGAMIPRGEPKADTDNTNFRLGFASHVATRDQGEMISDDYRWRRWESKTADFDANRATTGNHRKRDPELPEPKHREKHFRETVFPSGKNERETTQGRADLGDMPTADTLGSLARTVLSSSRHAES